MAHKINPCDLSRFFNGYMNVAALVFVLMGVMMILATSGYYQLLKEPEPLFGLTNKAFLFIAGTLHMVLGSYLLIERNLMNQGMLTLWAGWCSIVYCIGMTWMKVASPLPTAQLVGWRIGTDDTKIVDTFWRFFIAYLLIGSVSYLVLEWRRSKQLEIEMFLKSWGKLREHKVASSTKKAQGNISIGKSIKWKDSLSEDLTKDEMSRRPISEFKFYCPSCGQHILCDRGYSGRQINCPTCQKQILVPQANGS